LNTARTEQVETNDGAFNLKATYLINPQTFVELNAGYSFNSLDRFDPYIGVDNWLSYGDSVANAQVGWNWDRSRDPLDQQALDRRYQKPTRHNIFTFTFYDRGAVVAGIQKFNRENFNVSLNFTSQLNKEHNLKFGGEFQYYDIANFSFNNERSTLLAGKITTALGMNLGTNTPFTMGEIPSAQLESAAKIIRNEGVNNFGYNPFGEKTNDGLPEYEQSRNPNFLGIYVQDRIEYKDLIINAGLRYDRIDIDNWVPIDPTYPDATFNKQTKDVIASGLKNTEAVDFVSPRLGFSFALTEQTIFHAQWGKFVQQSRLRDIYQGLNATSINLSGGFQINAPVGFDVRPTRTTQYDVGFTQQIGEFASIDITGFYKDIQDQILYNQLNVADTSQFGAYFVLQNGDFATTKGIEIAYNMRRIERFKIDANITFQDAKGTSSYPNSSRGIAGAPLDGVTIFQPNNVTPLEYNQAIQAAFNLDYRFGEGDGGPVFQELGLTFLGTFSSGHPYTKGKGGADLEGDARDRQPLEPLNASTTPAIFQLDMRIDKTFDIADMFNLNIYFYVINLLDAFNFQNVFLRTGTADDDGYLGDPILGETVAKNFGPDFVALYQALNLDYYSQWYTATTGAAYTTQPFIYGPPRQIRFGIRVEY
jgi:outer membrane receptor for ferrienterochelin and colicin